MKAVCAAWPCVSASGSSTQLIDDAPGPPACRAGRSDVLAQGSARRRIGAIATACSGDSTGLPEGLFVPFAVLQAL